MIINDIRKEFFQQLKGRILIFSSLDVDAICSCKILQFLLGAYNLQYTVAPIESFDDLSKSFDEYRNSVDSVILLNFGNLINIPQVLKPPQDLNFYIIDSHRPINVHNYYKNPQVKLIINSREPDLNIPSRSKIFLEDDNGQELEDDESTLALLHADPRDLSNQQLEKRRELRSWLVQKQRVMFDYEEFHYYNRSISIIVYELACLLAKNNNLLLWLGIVGLTYQLKSEKITRELFETEAEKIIRFIKRNEISSHLAVGSNWSIKWEKDLQLDLYRKWTIYDSLWNTPLTVCKFQLYNDKGQRNLSEFLVECGLALVQCKQLYVKMSLEYKYQLLDDIYKVCLGERAFKYNLQELATRGFVMRSSFKTIFSACDCVLSIRALLESYDPKTTRTEKFVRAIESLSADDRDMHIMTEGCDLAKIQLQSMFRQVRHVLNNQKVIDSGVFFCVDLTESKDTDIRDFTTGDTLMSFARFLLAAYVSSKPSKIARRAVEIPLIIVCMDYNFEDMIYMGGVPPVALESKKNFFKMAFEQAATNIDCEIKPDLTETGLIRTNLNNKNILIDQMRTIME